MDSDPRPTALDPWRRFPPPPPCCPLGQPIAAVIAHMNECGPCWAWAFCIPQAAD